MKRFIAALVTAALVWAQPAAAQSVLRDAETEALFQDMMAPLAKAAGLGERDIKVVLINDDEINAFVAGGQVVYVFSGLLQAADTANEVQGVLAHELGHVANGHAVFNGGAQPAIGISILSMVLGLAAIAAGGGEAGAGILAAGQQAALGKYLAFSRVQEATTDAAGLKYLTAAGITGKGLLSFYKKLQQQTEFRYGTASIDPYMQTHPLSGQRIATLSADVQASPAYAKQPDPAIEERFRRIKAKLRGYAQPSARTLQAFPESDRSIYAHYARTYAYHKSGYPQKADAEAAALIRFKPDDPYFLEVQGQVLLEAGRPREALGPLKAATEGSRYSPLIATTYGHALIATEDSANYPEAMRVLRIAVARDDQNPFGWLQLGTVYERTGDTARAALATAERAHMTRDYRTATSSARYALANLPANSADWIRAQDIAMASKNQLCDDDNRSKNKKLCA